MMSRCISGRKKRGHVSNKEASSARILHKGKLLGYIVSERGIEANPEKITTISNMGPIRNVKGVQRLTDCLAALSRFISRLGKRGMPLYKLLKKTDAFIWTEEDRRLWKASKHH